MDSNFVVAIVTSVCTAGSTAGVAITALILSKKGIDRVEAALDRLTATADNRFTQMDARFSGIDTGTDRLTSVLLSIDKRLSIIEDRLGL